MKTVSIVVLIILAWISQISLQASVISVKQAAAEIDAILDASRKAAGVQRNPPISDEVFVRRVFLDLAGRIPTPRETQVVVGYQDAEKRAMVVETLMQRDSYASNFFNFWADILRYKTHNYHGPAGLEHAYRKFIMESLLSNKPYDRFVKELVSAKGYPWENGAVGYYERDFGMPLDNMAITSRVFLGTQIECAQCHDHPFDKWKQTDFYKLSAYTHSFTRRDPFQDPSALLVPGMDRKKWSEARLGAVFGTWIGSLNSREIGKPLKLPRNFDEGDAKPGDVMPPTPLFGPAAPVREGQDPAEVFGEWLTSPQNPRFTAVIVNRLWKKVFGMGVIRSFDNITDSTTPMIPALETYLERLMVGLRYDMKTFLKVLVNTNAYQSAVTPVDPSLDAPYLFPGPLLRRMTAEQIWDSLVALISHEPEARSSANDLNERRLSIIRQSTEALLAYEPDRLHALAVSEMKVKERTARVTSARRALNEELESVKRGQGDREKLKQLGEDVKRAEADADLACKEVAVKVMENFAQKLGGKDAKLNVDESARVYVPGNSLGGQWLQRVYLKGFGPDARTPEQREADAAAKKQKLSEQASKLGIEPKDHAAFAKYCEKMEAPNFKLKATEEGWFRAAELESPAPRGHFLRVMGQSDRDLVENGRQSAGIPQTLLLMNSDLVSKNGVMAPLSPLMLSIQKEKTPAAKMDAAYLALFSRKATPAEQAIWANANREGLNDIEDLVYALLNTQQFIFIQ